MFQFAQPTLVVRSFAVNDPSPDQPVVEISGRAAGFTSWLLTLMKLSTITTLTLKGDELSLVSAGFSGEKHSLIPVESIDTTECGYSKPTGWAFIGVILLLYGIGSGVMAQLLLGLVLAAICFAAYYFGGRMYMIVRAGSHEGMIQYKEGLVDGQSVNLERTLTAVGAINQAVMRKNRAP